MRQNVKVYAKKGWILLNVISGFLSYGRIGYIETGGQIDIWLFLFPLPMVVTVAYLFLREYFVPPK